jgi:hypothetical protein
MTSKAPSKGIPHGPVPSVAPAGKKLPPIPSHSTAPATKGIGGKRPSQSSVPAPAPKPANAVSPGRKLPPLTESPAPEPSAQDTDHRRSVRELPSPPPPSLLSGGDAPLQERPASRVVSVHDILTVILPYLPALGQWWFGSTCQRVMAALKEVMSVSSPPPSGKAHSISTLGKLAQSALRFDLRKKRVRLCRRCTTEVPIFGTDYFYLLRAYPVASNYVLQPDLREGRREGHLDKLEGRKEAYHAKFQRNDEKPADWPFLFFVYCDSCRNDPEACSLGKAKELLTEFKRLALKKRDILTASFAAGVETKSREYREDLYMEGFETEGGGAADLFSKEGLEIGYDGWSVGKLNEVCCGYCFPHPIFGYGRGLVYPAMIATTPGAIVRLLEAALNEEFSAARGESKARVQNVPRAGTSPQVTVNGLISAHPNRAKDGPKAHGVFVLPSKPSPAAIAGGEPGTLPELVDNATDREATLSPEEALTHGFAFTWESSIGKCRLALVTTILESLLHKLHHDTGVGEAGARAVPAKPSSKPSAPPAASAWLSMSDPLWGLLLAVSMTYYLCPYTRTYTSWVDAVDPNANKFDGADWEEEE